MKFNRTRKIICKFIESICSIQNLKILPTSNEIAECDQNIEFRKTKKNKIKCNPSEAASTTIYT